MFDCIFHGFSRGTKQLLYTFKYNISLNFEIYKTAFYEHYCIFIIKLKGIRALRGHLKIPLNSILFFQWLGEKEFLINSVAIMKLGKWETSGLLLSNIHCIINIMVFNKHHSEEY